MDGVWVFLVLGKKVLEPSLLNARAL